MIALRNGRHHEKGEGRARHEAARQELAESEERWLELELKQQELSEKAKGTG